MLRWMAPFLSFTAEEAWRLFAHGTPSKQTIFTETYWPLPTPDGALLARWARLREIRDLANKEIEAVRTTGAVGASLQATLTITAPPEDAALLHSLGADLRFVTITSAVRVVDGAVLSVVVTPSTAPKCERCWHYREDVGSDAAHPTICGRCVSNLHGAGETRVVA
jgi:isoleucyl-tRNA synthetase